MSAAGQLRELIEGVVAVFTGKLEERLDRLEERVAALEAPARKAAPAAKARPQTAEAKGTVPR